MKRRELKQLPTVVDDGLPTPIIKGHGTRKYRLVGHYDETFATGMKFKWKSRVYLDLFSGSGHANLEEEGIIVPGSPLLAVGVTDTFDKYIFCEKDPALLDALKTRVHGLKPDVQAAYILGDVNDNVGKIISEIPNPADGSVLTFCFVDPFSLDNLHFKTIKALQGARYMDFMMLIPSFMDANRNMDYYLDPMNFKVAMYLDDPKWRDAWEEVRRKGPMTFGEFLVRGVCRKMTQLGFIENKETDWVQVSNPRNRTPLYHFAFFSRHPRGMEFWRKAIKGTTEESLLPGLDGV